MEKTEQTRRYEDKDLLTTKEVCAYLGVSPAAISKWRMRGLDMKCQRLGNRCLYYFEDVTAFIKMMSDRRREMGSYVRKKSKTPVLNGHDQTPEPFSLKLIPKWLKSPAQGQKG